MPNKIRWLSILFVLAALSAVLAHGVVVPQFVWRPFLDDIQTQYPDQRIDIKRFVVGLSHRPHVILGGLSIRNDKRAESLEIGLLKLEVDGWQSIQAGQIIIDTLEVKGLNAQRTTSRDCNQQILKCLPLTPFGLTIALQTKMSKLPGKPSLALTDVELTQWQLKTTTLRGDESLSVYIDLLSFLITNETDDTAKLGLRLVQPSRPESTDAPINDLSLAISGVPKQSNDGFSIINLQADAKGELNKLPWSGSLAAEVLKFEYASPKESNAHLGSTSWRFTGSGLRTHLRRDDAPDTHQAAFSSLEFEGGLPIAPMQFRQAQWTFTNEKAKAWTFNMSIIPSLGLIEIQPAVIEGSEGEPAQAQSRILNCRSAPPTMLGLLGSPIKLQPEDILEEKPFWTWQDGWFQSVYEYPANSVDLVLCPVDQETKRKGLMQLDEHSSMSPHFVK